jgi:hypothetical protein
MNTPSRTVANQSIAHELRMSHDSRLRKEVIGVDSSGRVSKIPGKAVKTDRRNAAAIASTAPRCQDWSRRDCIASMLYRQHRCSRGDNSRCGKVALVEVKCWSEYSEDSTALHMHANINDVNQMSRENSGLRCVP